MLSTQAQAIAMTIDGMHRIAAHKLFLQSVLMLPCINGAVMSVTRVHTSINDRVVARVCSRPGECWVTHRSGFALEEDQRNSTCCIVT